jgi:hypothetical protein
MKMFSKFQKKNDYSNYLAKFVKQNFSKTLFDASENAKNTLFCDVTKVENFDKKCLTLSKKNKKRTYSLR